MKVVRTLNVGKKAPAWTCDLFPGLLVRANTKGEALAQFKRLREDQTLPPRTVVAKKK